MTHPDITVNRRTYKWNAAEQGYFGPETTCGSYGTLFRDGGWLPSCMNDNGFIDYEEAQYSTPEEAIGRSHDFFT